MLHGLPIYQYGLMRGFSSLRDGFKRLSSTPRLVGFIDQGALSAGNLIQTAAFARSLGYSSFGIIAAALSTAVLVQSLLRSGIFLPFLISRGEDTPTPATDWIHAVERWLAFTGFATAIVFTSTLIMEPKSQIVTWCCAAVMVLAMAYYDICRRFALSCGLYQPILISSLTMLIGWVALALTVFAFGGSVVLITLVNALISSIPAVFLARKLRKASPPRKGQIPKLSVLMGPYQHLVAWNISAFLPYSVYNNAAPIIATIFFSPAAIAPFAATRILLAPITMVGAAIDNIDKTRAAAALRERGIPGLRQSLISYGGFYLLLILPYVLLAGLFTTPLLTLAVGENFAHHSDIARLWLIVGLATAFCQPIESGLVLLRLSRHYFWSRLFGALAGGTAFIVTSGALSMRLVVAVTSGWLVASVSSGIILAVVLWRKQ